MLIKELLSLGRQKLRSSLDVEVLLAFVLGMSREEILAHDDMDVKNDASVKLFLKYVDEALAWKPIAYITKSKEFYGLDFYVDERVLIPRPETEGVVDVVLEYLNERAFADGKHSPTVSEDSLSVADSVNLGKDFTFLDVGTGSLDIATAVLSNFDNITAHAVDISKEALEVAVINREFHGLTERVQVYESNLLANVEERFFDVITANLPYVGTIKNNVLSQGAAEYEPHRAMFGGEDGLDVYRKFVQELMSKRMDFNLLVGEFGDDQKDDILELLNKNFVQKSKGKGQGKSKPKFEIEIKNDLSGKPRVFVVRKIG